MQVQDCIILLQRFEIEMTSAILIIQHTTLYVLSIENWRQTRYGNREKKNTVLL